jgi:hypothetical protein
MWEIWMPEAIIVTGGSLLRQPAAAAGNGEFKLTTP